MTDLVRIFETTKPDTLTQIRKESDAFLGAQLTVALAGNQRAMTFFGFLATASAVIGSASITVIASSLDYRPFGFIGLLVVLGLLTSMFLANMAAMPDGFYYVGNAPSSWVADVLEDKSPETSAAETLAFDDKNIAHNSTVLLRCATQIERAVWIAWGSMIFGAIGEAITFGLTHP